MSSINSKPPIETAKSFDGCLIGGGEMGTRMRELDWSNTEVGSPAQWPQSLKTSISICLNSSFAILLWWGPELVMLYNDAYIPVLGNKHPRSLGQVGRECWLEIWDIIEPMLQGVMETGIATRSDDMLLLMNRYGYIEETYFTFSYSPIRNETGGIGGIFTPVQETTDKIIGERRLRTLRDLAAQVVQKMDIEEVCSVTANTLSHSLSDIPFACVYTLNPSFTEARLSGASGIEWATAVSPQTVKLDNKVPSLYLEAFDSVIKSGQAIYLETSTIECEILPTGPWEIPPKTIGILPIIPHGTTGPAALLVVGISPMRSLDNNYKSFLNLVASQIATSISEARAFEQESQRAESLAELDRAKTAFFSNVSHEFRTPLTLILGQIENLLEGPQDARSETDSSALKVVHRNGMRLLKLVNSLLDFSRIEAGRAVARFELVELGGFTSDLASVFRSAIDQAGMELLVNCPTLKYLVSVDREMWEKIVLNLLSNAFKFTETGEIEVRLEEFETLVKLIIRDTGTGISADHLPHIFERFHRVEGTRARTQEGTGIGLALVRELATLLGGEVGVQSELGVGTEFTVSLPTASERIFMAHPAEVTTSGASAELARLYVSEVLGLIPEKLPLESPVAVQNTTSGTSNPPSTSETRSTVLIADDNADMRDYVAGLLKPIYEVTMVSNGLEALETIQKQIPDLLLSDVMMPGLDGFQLIQAVRDIPATKSLPIILLSARAGEEAHIEGLAAQADDYLIKPFSSKELLARVASHIEMSRIRKSAAQDREKLVDEVLAERSRLTEIFMQAPAFIAVLQGPEHVFERANPRYNQLTGHRDLLGRSVKEAFPEIPEQGFNEILDEVYSTGLAYIGTDSKIMFQENAETEPRERYMDFVYQPMYESSGQVSGIFIHGVDITDRKQAELDLQMRSAEIESLNARLRRAMTETHHRVKNNLQLISALIDIQRASGEQSVPMFEFARLGANVRALGVIHDILTQETKAGNDQEMLSADALIQRLILELVQTTGGRQIIANAVPMRLTGRQATTLALVTNELISNALKHGSGAIEVNLDCSGSQGSLAVHDDGPGFPDGFDSVTASNTGLELVENIVDWDLGGKIHYMNGTAGGGTVVVSFPIDASLQS